MEFNPLDLLASAAELQQRHDEPSSNMTRQRKATTLTSKIITINSKQKENKDANKSSVKNNGVIIVKKIKIGASSDLEKMLDEHNYGNAKKGIKFEKNVQTVSNDSLTQGIASSVSSDREYEPTELRENETTESISMTKPDGLPIDTLQTTSSNFSAYETVQSCIYIKSDTSNVLPQVETEKTDCSTLTSSERCPSHEPINTTVDSQVIDVPRGHSPYKLDNNSVQTINLMLNKSNSKMCPESNAETNCTQPSKENTVSVSCNVELPAGAADESGNCKKVTVKFSPENNIFIEEKNLNENKNVSPVNYLCNNLVLDTHLVEIMSEKNDTSSHRSSVEEKSDFTNCQENPLVKDHGNSKSVTIIRSLLTTDNVSGRCVRTAKLHNGSLRVNCDTESYYLHDLKEKMDSCDSPKSRLELDPFCNTSSNGIHLLSPDRRNPDSVGIVESPVTSAFTDSSNSYETETDIEKDENSSLSPKTVPESSKITLEVCDETVVESRQNIEVLNTKLRHEPEMLNTELPKSPETVDTDSKQKIRICVKEPEIKQEPCQSSSCEKEQDKIFRFESDHCYAGLPGNIDNVDMRRPPDDEETDSDDEEEDDDDNASSPSVSPTELSQDSGYGDIAQTPDCEKKDESSVRPTTEKLVPVLISFNKSGSLTVHTDKGISKELPRQIFTLSENQTVDSNANLLNTDKAQNLNKPLPSNVRPLLLSPIGKGTASVLIDPSKILIDPKKVTGIVSPSAKGFTLHTPAPQVSPPKFGKFRIGTFASFSNTGMDLDSPVKDKTKVDRTSKTSPFSRTSSVLNNPAFKSPVDKSSLRQIDSYKGSASSLLNSPVAGYANHIQHDHDYCLHSLMPSTIDSAKENNQKDYAHKNKSGHLKTKKNDSELQKIDKSNKRKGKNAKNLVEKEDSVDEMELLLDEERYRDLPSFAETMRAKTRTEKYIEQKSSEPKMKITGSSNFQDQFVYFMNTKKRSRRRESRDGRPIQVPFDRIILPPHKPGDIVVPHLTDADIEHLKLINKQSKSGTYVSQTGPSDPFSSKSTLPNSSQSASSEINADEESKIINTILSLENENLTDEQVPYSENMELYGQSDIMSLLPEQMNLTQEQMDLLFSAVDEVQNSSPSQLASAVPSDPTFGQFPVEDEAYSDTLVGKSPMETGGDDADSTDSASVQNSIGMTSCDKDGPPLSVIEESVSVVDASDKSSSSNEVTVDHGLASKIPIEEHDNSVVTNSDSASSLISDSSNSVDKPTGLLSETLSDAVTKESFTSLNRNSDSDSTENSLTQASTSSLAFSNLSSSVNSDLPLPTLDKTSLDIFGSDYRLDRSDLFPDASLQDSAVPAQGSIPVPPPLDYNAPWIVTVSMYWNDLPAIMINNLPYVRLVDIHKQILPAKDTGILKKRCQLMGIEVGNCSEMQRYFLVQYGKAVNSKSTLIVSKDAAKVLIGYYVDPQPAKCLNTVKEHKSIIEHRREQLRRIALAKRAALRAERLEKERALEAEAGTSLLKPVEGDATESAQGASDVQPVSPRQRSHSLSSRFQQTHTLGTKPQRSTRHKKINFLELLRGDSSSNLPEGEDHASQVVNGKKKLDHSTGAPNVKPSSKRKRRSGSSDGKVKVVRYIESESSESTEEVSSEYTSEDTSDSSESEKVVVVKTTKRKRTSLLRPKVRKTKYKKSVVLKRNVVKVPSFKVKFKSLAKVQCKQVSKDQAKSGKIPPQSRIHIVKLSSGESSVSKKDLAVVKDLTEKEDSVPPKVDTVYSDIKDVESFTNASVEVEVIRNVNDFHVSSVDSDIATDHVTNSSDSEHNLDTVDDEREHSEQKNVEEENLEAKIQLKQGNNTDLKAEINKDSTSDINKVKVSEHVNIAVTESGPEDTIKTSLEDTVVVDTENTPIASCSSSEDVATKKETDTENSVNHKSQTPVQDCGSEIDKVSSGKNGSAKLTSACSEPVETTVKNVNFFLLNKEHDIVEEAPPPVRIVHRDASPQNSAVRSRRQLGEVFVEHYNNKRSFCIRCYTCRKMMSVDNFMRHLHDVSGGLISTDVPQIIEPSDPEMTDSELKSWEVFQRKKELFDNNQLPSDVARSSIMFNVDSESFAEKPADETSRGPIIIQTPVSPVKTLKVKAISKPEIKTKKKASVPHQPKIVKTLEKSRSWSAVAGIRASSRKRKASQLFSSDEYTFDKKLPRLQNELEDGNENGMELR